ncbi:MAG: F0F1 ATP synthase subunit alpha, partial [Bacteroidota bacterium]|nr:F0F1 ATP synthase subunit alpha [Bacteroidota bacterium]
LEAFSKFGSDLDAATKNVLEKGARNVEILKQGLFSPVRVEKQIAILYCGTRGLMMDVPVGRVDEFEAEFIRVLEAQHNNVLETLSRGEINDSVTQVLEAVAKDVSAKFKA